MAPRSNDNLSQVPFFVIPRKNLIALLRGQLKTNTGILHAVSIPLWTPCTARTQKLVCCKNQPSEIKKNKKSQDLKSTSEPFKGVTYCSSGRQGAEQLHDQRDSF